MLRWNLFIGICIIQIIGTSVLGMQLLSQFISTGNFSHLMGVLAMLLAFLLSIFGIRTVNRNYPALPVTGSQKKNFNRLFLANTLISIYLFAIVFARYNYLGETALLAETKWYKLPYSITYTFYLRLIILSLHLLILYGLFVLRSELYTNSMKKEFEFEKILNPKL